MKQRIREEKFNSHTHTHTHTWRSQNYVIIILLLPISSTVSNEFIRANGIHMNVCRNKNYRLNDILIAKKNRKTTNWMLTLKRVDTTFWSHRKWLYAASVWMVSPMNIAAVKYTANVTQKIKIIIFTVSWIYGCKCFRFSVAVLIFSILSGPKWNADEKKKMCCSLTTLYWMWFVCIKQYVLHLAVYVNGVEFAGFFFRSSDSSEAVVSFLEVCNC